MDLTAKSVNICGQLILKKTQHSTYQINLMSPMIEPMHASIRTEKSEAL